MFKFKYLWGGWKLLVMLVVVLYIIAPTAGWAGSEVEPFALVFTSPKSKQELCMDVKGALIDPGTPVQLYYCNGSYAQKWTLEGEILHGIGGKCLTIAQEEKTVQVSDCQKFPLAWTDNDLLTKNIHVGGDLTKCLGFNDLDRSLLSENVKAVNCLIPGANVWTKEPLVAKLQSGTIESNAKGRVTVADKDTQAEFREGLIYIKGSDKLFNSKYPQSLGKAEECTISGLNWKAYYTTFYIIKNDGSLWVVNSCGKAPLEGDTEKSVTITEQKDAKGNIYNDGQINHSIIAKSETVLGAGEIDIVNGEIKYIDNCSGHYKPNSHLLLHGIFTLAQAGAKGLKDRKLRIADLTYVVGVGQTPEKGQTERKGTGNCFSYKAI